MLVIRNTRETHIDGCSNKTKLQSRTYKSCPVSFHSGLKVKLKRKEKPLWSAVSNRSSNRKIVLDLFEEQSWSSCSETWWCPQVFQVLYSQVCYGNLIVSVGLRMFYVKLSNTIINPCCTCTNVTNDSFQDRDTGHLSKSYMYTEIKLTTTQIYSPHIGSPILLWAGRPLTFLVKFMCTTHRTEKFLTLLSIPVTVNIMDF